MDARIEKLESKLTFAEDLLDELNRTVYRQQLQIDQLQEQIRALYRQIQSAPPAERRDPSEEIPPHY